MNECGRMGVQDHSMQSFPITIPQGGGVCVCMRVCVCVSVSLYVTACVCMFLCFCDTTALLIKLNQAHQNEKKERWKKKVKEMRIEIKREGKKEIINLVFFKYCFILFFCIVHKLNLFIALAMFYGHGNFNFNLNERDRGREKEREKKR